MKIKGLNFFLILILFLSLCPSRVFGAVEYDLGLDNGDVWFSKTKFFAGEKVKIYAQINNYGSKDASAYVIFYQGQTTVGEPQPISVVAGGTEDAVWVDWLAEAGPNDITVRIVGQTPADSQADNDSITIPVDIVADNDDDGLGNDEDLDDDNDGLPDAAEAVAKTNPLNPDTDNDGVIDSQDAYSLDATKSVKEEPKPAPLAARFVPSLLNPKPKPEVKAEDAVLPLSPTKSEIPFFEFESERAAKIKERQEAGSALIGGETKPETEKTRMISFSKNFWLLIIMFIGLVFYFSPQLAKLIKHKRRKGKKR